MKIRWCCLLPVAVTLFSVPAHVWDQKGHRVVAAVAWEHMDSETRTKAVALLRGAPGDADLLAEDAGSALPQAARDRALFLRAATWPDLVRDRGNANGVLSSSPRLTRGTSGYLGNQSKTAPTPTGLRLGAALDKTPLGFARVLFLIFLRKRGQGFGSVLV